jgi:hypothetical protein
VTELSDVASRCVGEARVVGVGRESQGEAQQLAFNFVYCLCRPGQRPHCTAPHDYVYDAGNERGQSYGRGNGYVSARIRRGGKRGVGRAESIRSSRKRRVRACIDKRSVKRS